MRRVSTRGAIAVPNPHRKGWWGRYHHFDSYPMGLGQELFRLYHDTFDRDATLMAQVLVHEHPAGWSNLVRPYTPRPFEREDFEHAGFRGLGDPEHDAYPLCYCHGARKESAHALTCACPGGPEGCGPVFIEWAYVLTVTGMFVATSWHPNAEAGRALVHRLVALVDWDRPEPDWVQVQHRARAVNVPDLTL